MRGDYIAFVCFVWITEQTVTFSIDIVNRLVSITEAESVTGRYGLGLDITQIRLVFNP